MKIKLRAAEEKHFDHDNNNRNTLCPCVKYSLNGKFSKFPDT